MLIISISTGVVALRISDYCGVYLFNSLYLLIYRVLIRTLAEILLYAITLHYLYSEHCRIFRNSMQLAALRIGFS